MPRDGRSVDVHTLVQREQRVPDRQYLRDVRARQQVWTARRRVDESVHEAMSDDTDDLHALERNLKKQNTIQRLLRLGARGVVLVPLGGLPVWRGHRLVDNYRGAAVPPPGIE